MSFILMITAKCQAIDRAKVVKKCEISIHEVANFKNMFNKIP